MKNWELADQLLEDGRIDPRGYYHNSFIHVSEEGRVDLVERMIEDERVDIVHVLEMLNYEGRGDTSEARSHRSTLTALLKSRHVTGKLRSAAITVEHLSDGRISLIGIPNRLWDECDDAEFK